MKRTIAMILALLVFFTCNAFIASAETTKLSEELQDVLSKSEPDDPLHVYITYAIESKSIVDMPSWPDIHSAVDELAAYRKAKQAEVQAVIFDGLEVSVLSIVAYDGVIAEVKAKDIEAVAACDLVAYIWYSPAIEQIPAEGINYYLDPDGDGKFIKEYRLVKTDNPDYEEYMIRNVWLRANDRFRICSSTDGTNTEAFYPDFLCDTSLMVHVDGVYDIYFRPDGQGGTFYDNTGWVAGCIYVDDSKAVKEHKELLFKDKFLAYTKKISSGRIPYSTYDELYYHYGADGEIDWALVEGTSNWENNLVGVWRVGNRIISHQGSSYLPFACKMAVYDVKNDTFVDVNVPSTVDMEEQYEGFYKVYNEIGYGKLVGDIDEDDALTTVDSTIVQRCESGLQEYPQQDEVINTQTKSIIKYYSDFNYDGERDILDATCIQRYLADMSYPVG